MQGRRAIFTWGPCLGVEFPAEGLILIPCNPILKVPPLSTMFAAMQFYKLAKGARFEFRGRQFTKLAMSMAKTPTASGTYSRAARR